jgi:RNA recognition motif-containing protein
MSVRLFVGNLAYDVTEAELREFFSAAGTPLSIRMPTDRETGKLRGFAFVEFSDAAQAEEAIRRFNQQVFKGRPLVVNEARPREAGPAPRSNAFAQVGRSGVLGSEDRAPRPDQPKRTFGPDALPRERRKPRGHSSKGERAVDDVAFWDRAASESQTEE